MLLKSDDNCGHNKTFHDFDLFRIFVTLHSHVTEKNVLFKKYGCNIGSFRMYKIFFATKDSYITQYCLKCDVK